MHQIWYIENLLKRQEYLTPARKEQLDSNSVDINLNAVSLALEFFTKVIDSSMRQAQLLLDGKVKQD